MTYVTVATDLVGTAAGELARIGSEVSAANAASAPTMELAPAGADELSAAVAALFGGYGRAYQAVSAEAAAFHRQFVKAMTASAGSYAGAEVANAWLLQTLDQEVPGWVNATTHALSGRPLFGNGHTETAAGPAGGNGEASGLFGTGGTGGRHGGTGLGRTNAVTLGSGTASAGSSGGAGSNASAPHTLDVSPTTASDTGGIALVMGPTGIPQPSAAYVATVDRLYLQPLGFHGHAQSLYTPELGYNTDANLPTDVADLMAAIHAQIATGQVSAQNPIWVFGYSQSSAAASEAMVQLHAEGVPAGDLHFVLVGDPASASGGILNTLMPSLGPLGGLIQPLLPWFDLSQTMGLTTPNYYPADVYTLAGDGYAAWPQNFFSNPIADINAISGFFSTHEEYLGLSPGQIQGATPTHTDGLVQYYTIDNSGQLLPTLINAAVNVDWISPATGEFLNWLF